MFLTGTKDESLTFLEVTFVVDVEGTFEPVVNTDWRPDQSTRCSSDHVNDNGYFGLAFSQSYSNGVATN